MLSELLVLIVLFINIRLGFFGHATITLSEENLLGNYQNVAHWNFVLCDAYSYELSTPQGDFIETTITTGITMRPLTIRQLNYVYDSDAEIK